MDMASCIARCTATRRLADTRVHARQYVLVTLNLGQPLSFGGTEEPAAYGTLLSIGAISPAQNKNTSKLVRPGAEQQPTSPSK